MHTCFGINFCTMRCLRRCAIALLFLTSSLLRAEVMEILRAGEAEYIELERSGPLVTMQGGIILKYSGYEIRADTVELRTDTGDLIASNGVSMKRDSTYLEGESLIFNVRTGKGVLYRTNMSEADMKLKAFKIRIAEEGYAVERARITSCDAETPHYYLRTPKIYLFSNGDFLAFHAVTVVGHTPVFYFPLVLQRDVGTGIITQYGQSSLRGHFLQNTYRETYSDTHYSLPQKIDVTGDYYQYGGEVAGITAERKTSMQNYLFSGQLARHEDTEKITVNGETATTDQILQSDGSREKQEETWYHIQGKFDQKFSHGQEKMSRILIDFEDSAHRNFEREYGRRLEPDNTFDALFSNDTLQGDRYINYTYYSGKYSLTWESANFSIYGSQKKKWDYRDEGEYRLYQETLPAYTFQHTWLLPMSLPGVEGFFNRHTQQGSYTRGYNIGELSYERYDQNIQNKSGFLIHPGTGWTLIPYITPSINYRSTTVDTTGSASEEDVRNQYLYATSGIDNTFQFPYFSASQYYRYQYSVVESEEDPDLGKERLHDLTMDAQFFPFYVFRLSAETNRDFKDYGYPLAEHVRWPYVRGAVTTLYDFRYGFPGQKFGIDPLHSHYQELLLEAEHEYAPRYQRPFLTRYTMLFRTGGYNLFLLEKLKSFSVGGKFLQNHINPYSSEAVLQLGTEVYLHKWWLLRFEGQSLAEQIFRYYTGDSNERVDFFQDIGNGFTGNEDTVFNIHHVYAALEHDLHKWLMTLSYELDRKTYYYGDALRQSTSLYEHRVFLTFRHKGMDLDSGFETQLYRYDPVRSGDQTLP